MKSTIDQYASLDSTIHRWDPRIKILSILFIIFVIGTIKTLEIALAAFVLAVVMAVLSGLPFEFIFNRLKIVIFFLLPFFLILPFSMTGGKIYHLYYLNASSAGLIMAATIFLRGITIVTLVFPMLSTSQFETSLKALERLKIPSTFIQILMFSYRYIFVLSDEMSRMNTALTSRGFKKKMNLKTLRVLGNFIGVLLLRSFERAERVLYAMQSRGYKGKLITRFDYHWKTKDFIKGFLVFISGLFLLTGDSWNKDFPALMGGGHHGHGGFSVWGLDFGLITGIMLLVFILLAVLSKTLTTVDGKRLLHKWHRIGVYGAAAVLLLHGIYNFLIHFSHYFDR